MVKINCTSALKAVIPTSPTEWNFLMLKNLICGWCYWYDNTHCALPDIMVMLSSHKYNDSEELQWRKFYFHSSAIKQTSCLCSIIKVIALLCHGIKHHYIQTVPLSEVTLSKNSITADSQWFNWINFTVFLTISNSL